MHAHQSLDAALLAAQKLSSNVASLNAARAGLAHELATAQAEVMAARSDAASCAASRDTALAQVTKRSKTVFKHLTRAEKRITRVAFLAVF